MTNSVGSFFQNHFLNIPGKAIGKKVVVFESDDWGGIRIPSLKTYHMLKSKGIQLDKNPYNQFDSLESKEDLEAMFEVLSSVKDHKGNYPVLTANFIVANPDFEKIRESKFSQYYYELFTETYKRNQLTEGSWVLVKEGIDRKIIKPQFHGRDHVNATRWLSILQAGERNFVEAFDAGVFSVDYRKNGKKRENLMATLDYENKEEQSFAYDQLKDGIEIYKKIFGGLSESFIAPCNVWDSHAEKILLSYGVKFIQGFLNQNIPSPGSDSYKFRKLRIGELSEHGQVYLVRNAYFEPSTSPNYDWIGNCLRKIQAAFFWNKPAIISVHRLNFVGTLSQENRNQNLLLFEELLKKILKNWPEVEFLSSDQLGHLYNKTI